MPRRTVNIKHATDKRYISKEYRVYERYVRIENLGINMLNALYTTANRQGFMSRLLGHTPPPKREFVEIPEVEVLPYHRHKRYAHLVPKEQRKLYEWSFN